MKQAIIIVLDTHPEIKEAHKESEAFRPHITLVYEFDNVNQEQLFAHIKKVCSEVEPFHLSLQGLQNAPHAHILYLLVDKGKEQVIKLYDKLNADLLKGFGNPDMDQYIPHLNLGEYDNEDEVNLAMEECPALFFETTVTEIHLIDLDDENFTPFKLGKQ